MLLLFNFSTTITKFAPGGQVKVVENTISCIITPYGLTN